MTSQNIFFALGFYVKLPQILGVWFFCEVVWLCTVALSGQSEGHIGRGLVGGCPAAPQHYPGRGRWLGDRTRCAPQPPADQHHAHSSAPDVQQLPPYQAATLQAARQLRPEPIGTRI